MINHSVLGPTKSTQWHIYLLSLCLCLGFILLQVPPYFLKVYVPDEIWFEKDSVAFSLGLEKKGIIEFLFSQENHLGYGSIYWIIHTVTTKLFSHSLSVMRGLSFLALASVPFSLLLSRTHNSFVNLFSLSLWILFPMSWWYGKINGPEIFSYSAASVAMFFLLHRESKTGHLINGLFFLGIAVGIKLSTVITLPFAGIIVLYKYRINFERLIKGPASLFLGFFAANPFLILHPAKLLHFNSKIAFPQSFTLERLKYFVTNQFWEWDAVFVGGITEWSTNIAGFVLLLVYAYFSRVPRFLLLAFLASFFTSLCLFHVGGYLGWYWFPLIIVVPWSFLQATHLDSRAMGLGCLTLVFLLVTNFPDIRKQYLLKLSHAKMIDQRPSVIACLESQHLEKFGITAILDYTEIGLNLPWIDLTRSPNVRLYTNNESFRWMKWDHRELEWPEAFIIGVGDRLKQFHEFKGTEAYLKNIVKEKGSYQLKSLPKCNFVELYLISLNPGSRV